jgi:hypothetical protein
MVRRIVLALCVALLVPSVSDHLRRQSPSTPRLVSSALSVAPRGVLQAAGNCSCYGTTHGYQYPNTWVANANAGTHGPVFVLNNVACSSVCQNWIMPHASAMCDNQSLNNGVGYVIVQWSWTYSGSPSDQGGLQQQFDCDDV